MLNKKTFLAVCLLVVPIFGAAQDRAVLGPIESVSPSRSTITVLGQTFQVTAKTIVTVDGKSSLGRKGLSTLESAQYAHVEGMASRDGAIAASISIASTDYVPGASQTFVLGTVDQIYPLEGQIRVGTLRIDLSFFSPALDSTMQVGTLVYVSGIQPVPNGLLVNTGTLGVVGSGTQSVGGSGVLSVGGSGVLSVGGSGTLSVGGSGKQSIGGSGKQSVGGSGVLSVGGSGVLSVGGSGIQ
jgi:hypothetical protein